MKFLIYQLYCSVADYNGFDGYGELGFDSGEGAWETATTSKEGSRRANYPISKRWGSEVQYKYGSKIYFHNLNEYNVK